MSLFISKSVLLSVTMMGPISTAFPSHGTHFPNSADATSRSVLADPLVGVVVLVQNQRGGPTVRLTTNAQGRFQAPLPAGEYKITVESSSIEASLRALSKPTSVSTSGGGGAGKVNVQDFHFVMNFACCVAAGDVNGDGVPDRRMHKPFVITKEWQGHSFKVESNGLIVSGQLLASPAPRK